MGNNLTEAFGRRTLLRSIAAIGFAKYIPHVTAVDDEADFITHIDPDDGTADHLEFFDDEGEGYATDSLPNYDEPGATDPGSLVDDNGEFLYLNAFGILYKIDAFGASQDNYEWSDSTADNMQLAKLNNGYWYRAGDGELHRYNIEDFEDNNEVKVAGSNNQAAGLAFDNDNNVYVSINHGPDDEYTIFAYTSDLSQELWNETYSDEDFVGRLFVYDDNLYNLQRNNVQIIDKSDGSEIDSFSLDESVNHEDTATKVNEFVFCTFSGETDEFIKIDLENEETVFITDGVLDDYEIDFLGGQLYTRSERVFYKHYYSPDDLAFHSEIDLDDGSIKNYIELNNEWDIQENNGIFWFGDPTVPGEEPELPDLSEQEPLERIATIAYKREFQSIFASTLVASLVASEFDNPWIGIGLFTMLIIGGWGLGFVSLGTTFSVIFFAIIVSIVLSRIDRKDAIEIQK